MKYNKVPFWTYFCICFSLFLGLSSCDDSVIFREKINLDSQNWKYPNQLKYNWSVKDTLAWYSLQLKIDHNVYLDYRNLYVKCHTLFPDGLVKEQVLSLELFDERGNPFGKCGSSSCITEIVLLPKTKFEFLGNYQLSIEQYGRDSMIPGLNSFEIVINTLDISKGNF